MRGIRHVTYIYEVIIYDNFNFLYLLFLVHVLILISEFRITKIQVTQFNDDNFNCRTQTETLKKLLNH